MRQILPKKNRKIYNTNVFTWKNKQRKWWGLSSRGSFEDYVDWNPSSEAKEFSLINRHPNITASNIISMFLEVRFSLLSCRSNLSFLKVVSWRVSFMFKKSIALEFKSTVRVKYTYSSRSNILPHFFIFGKHH